MSIVEILNKNVPFKKQFVLKCKLNRFRCYDCRVDRCLQCECTPFIINGFLEYHTHTYSCNECWMISSGYSRYDNQEINYIYVDNPVFEIFTIWYVQNSLQLHNEFNVDKIIILPSRQEIQFNLIQNSCLSQYVIHKIVQVYM